MTLNVNNFFFGFGIGGFVNKFLGSPRDTVWSVLAGCAYDGTPSIVLHDVRAIETWVLRLLSAPVPVPGKTRLELEVLSAALQPCGVLALPDHTRFSLVDYPLHLPLELLGVDMCLKVLTLILLEHKVSGGRRLQ